MIIHGIFADVVDFLDKYAGGILAGAFFLLMARIFYWIVVIVPRRTKEIYDQLKTREYRPQSADDGSVARLLPQYAAIYPKDPVIDADVPAWKVRRAALRDQWRKKRLIVNAERLQQDKGGVKYNHTSCTTTILVETRALPLRANVHLVPAKNNGRIWWEKRYGLARVSSGDSALLTHYEVYAAPDATVNLSAELIQVLIEVCPMLVEKSRFCFQHGVSLRFQPGGWGITTSNEIYKQENMDLLLDAADRIAKALVFGNKL